MPIGPDDDFNATLGMIGKAKLIDSDLDVRVFFTPNI
jgi:hypothetical protein